MPMLVDLNSATFRGGWGPVPLAIGILYFFAFGRRSPSFYKAGLTHQSHDWREVWYKLTDSQARHGRAYRAHSKVLLPWSFMFVSPSHHFLWSAERRIKNYLREHKAWARPSHEPGYTETFHASLLETMLALVDSAKAEYVAQGAPKRFRYAWRCSGEALVSSPLSIDRVRALLAMPVSQLPTTAEDLVRSVRKFDRPS